MSKAITQNRNESESNGKRDEISRSTEELNSIEGDLNLTESELNQNNSLVNLTKPSIKGGQARGYCKLFENGEVSIRWYSNSKTLTVKGEKADEIKEKLLNFDRKLSGEVKVYSESPKVANILEPADRNLHSRKLDALAEEISTIKENKENAAYGILILEETVNELKKEKYELNRENEKLKEKNKNLFQSLSEVRAKVIELQDESHNCPEANSARISITSRKKKKMEDLESENKNLRATTRTLQEDLDKSNREKREFTKVKKRSENVSITADTTISC
ncbi:Hypothetical predicted protein [Paramuricea clavata]|uniref:Uncharacterized protein n=1 Tax=Paramuricea clavata TaxID=317549 RepID=A0A7D9EMZ8_PARCT|nr:Hypothetical predicted protein [Paramuricea clavata]